MASGYYCDSDQCGDNEYCCGQNICCSSYAVWQMWYFWCGCVLFVIMLSACAGFCKYRYYHTAIIIHGGGSTYSRLENGTTALYAPLPQQDKSATEGKYLQPQGHLPSYPPPAYSAEKDPSYRR